MSFILPKKNKTILECLNNFFSSASGVYICWRNFGTNGVFIDSGDPILMHLTAASQPFHPRNAAGKSIVKVDDVLIDQVWSPHQLVLRDGSQYYNGSGDPLYFKGLDLQVNSQHTSDYIQINHYSMRDEDFYLNVRLPKTKPQLLGEHQLELFVIQEHYQSFNCVQDYEIIEFLKNNYPSMYYSFWLGK